jgi:hypothetical protein
VIFWLGVYHVDWLTRTDVPMMLSYRWLAPRRTLPVARGRWVQDSGGFTELSLHGGYAASPQAYAERTRLHALNIGGMQWAAIQDWMCEDAVLAKTGLSIVEHQRKTVESLLDLRELAPDVNWLPVLQGQQLGDYLEMLEMYDRAGVDLLRAPLVGVGTVCRRQHTLVAARLIRDLAAVGLKLHGFGLKITSVLKCRGWLCSGDSMAWSIDGRYPQGGRCQRQRDHEKCSNCLNYAMLWRQRLVDRLGQQLLWA